MFYCFIPPVSCSCIRRAWKRTPCPQRARGDKSDNPRPGTKCGPEGSRWKIHKYKCNIYILYTSSSNPVRKIYQYISNSRTIPSIIPNICLSIFIVQKIFQRGTLFFLFDKFFPTEYIYLDHIQILVTCFK